MATTPGLVGGDLLQRFDIVARGADKARHQRLESGLNPAVAGGGQRGQGAAVEGAFQHDDGGFFDVAPVAVQTAPA